MIGQSSSVLTNKEFRIQKCEILKSDNFDYEVVNFDSKSVNFIASFHTSFAYGQCTNKWFIDSPSFLHIIHHVGPC
jgi:hypothetical protein